MTLVEIVTALVALGVGVGGGFGGAALTKRRQPHGTPRPAAVAPALTDSQRMEIPFVAHELCDERHERIDARLRQIDTKLGTVAEGVAEIRGALAAKGARR